MEQLIRRQVNASKQISDLRLKYITLRDELAEKTAELKALDNIGDDLSLMDYEQLKIENRWEIKQNVWDYNNFNLIGRRNY